jgi:hypothetical protein
MQPLSGDTWPTRLKILGNETGDKAWTVLVTGEECAMSSECDIGKGLCCQLQRRHRQAPRKVSKGLLLTSHRDTHQTHLTENFP